MRRYLKWLSLLAVLSVILYACGGETTDTTEASDDGATETTAETDDDGATETTTASDDGATETTTAGVDAASYYADQVIRFVTSSGAGGGTDTKTRTLAIQLPRFIEGDPATRVSNVTPHVAGMNFLWNSEPDGYTVGVTAAPTLEFEFFEGSEWNSSEWQYVGAMDAVCDNMLLVRGDVGYDSIEDMIGADGPTLITMTSAPSPADVEPVALSTMLIADYLDLPLEVRRVAESGTSALNLALERGEINFARYGSDWCRMPDANPGWLADGFVIPILDVATGGPGAQMADGVEERGERPPHVSEVLTEEQYAQWRGLVAASRAGGNPIFLPPGTPDDVANILRDAFDTAVQDEDFVDAMKTAFGGSDIRFLNHEEATQLFSENLEVMTEFNEQFEEITEELFAKYVK